MTEGGYAKKKTMCNVVCRFVNLTPCWDHIITTTTPSSILDSLRYFDRCQAQAFVRH